MTAPNALKRPETSFGRFRLGPLPWRFAAVVVATLVAAEFVAIYVSWFQGSPNYWLGMDYDFYRELGRTWLATGAFYLPEQLAGPYAQTTMVHNPYPPHALLLFVPFAFLPAALWWAIPLGLMAYVIWDLRPAPWACLLMLALVAWPRSVAGLLTGNSDMWVAAFIAAGITWGWPAVAVTIKPSLAPMLILGLRRPARMAAAAILLLGVVALGIPLWADYATVLGNMSIDPGYSLHSIPLMLVPLVAFATSTRLSPLTQMRNLLHRVSVT